MTDRLKEDLPHMPAEHKHVVGSLETLRLHAEFEEQVLYPAAILVGEQVKVRLAG